jgi:lipopolysaccharide transport system permease protein
MAKLFKSLAKAISQRQVIWGMVVKNLRNKYSGSVLGIAWALINPLLITLVISFVFTCILKAEVPRYPVFVLSGLIPWFFFVNSMSEATTSLRDHLEVLNRFIIPKEVIPLSIVVSNFINFVLGFVIMLPIFFLSNVRILHGICFLPLLMLLLFLFALGIAFMLSIAYVYCKDTAQLMLWFWVTPVFYPIKSIPEQLRWVLHLNPAAGFIALCQSLLYEGLLGSWSLWLASSLIAFFIFFIGYSVFLRHEDKVLKYI